MMMMMNYPSNILTLFKLSIVQKNSLLHKSFQRNNNGRHTANSYNDATSAGEFSLELPHKIQDDRKPTTIGAQDKLMRWHYRLNHLSFKHLFQLAKQ